MAQLRDELSGKIASARHGTMTREDAEELAERRQANIRSPYGHPILIGAEIDKSIFLETEFRRFIAERMG